MLFATFAHSAYALFPPNRSRESFFGQAILQKELLPRWEHGRRIGLLAEKIRRASFDERFLLGVYCTARLGKDPPFFLFFATVGCFSATIFAKAGASTQERMSKDSKSMTEPLTTEEPTEVENRSGGETPKIDWEKALREHEQWLKTIIGARLGEPQAVDEVWQEVSMAAVRQKAPIQDPAKVAPWLYRIAVMQSLMYRRKMGRRRKMVDRYVEYYEPRESQQRESDPLNQLLLEERREHVQQAMQRLPKRDAEMLMLKYAHGWSYRGIADRLGTSVSAVQARLHRARKRLRDELTADTTIAEEP